MTIIESPQYRAADDRVDLGRTEVGPLGHVNLFDARTLYERLEGVLRDAPWPRLSVVETNEDVLQFRCPYPDCGTTFDDFTVDDVGSRTSWLDTDWNAHTVIGYYDSSGEYQSLYYTCPNCGEAVRLPEGWKET